MLYIFTYTVQKIRTHCVFERSLLCSSTVTLAYVIKNTEKNNNIEMWNIITT